MGEPEELLGALAEAKERAARAEAERDRLRKELTLAANRLEALSIMAPYNSTKDFDGAKWAEEARAALAPQETPGNG